MTLTVVWVPDALNAYRRLRAEDAQGASTVVIACRKLAADPRPVNSRPLGSGAFWRLRIGDFRVLYQFDEVAGVLWISHVGRVPPVE